MKKFSYEIIKFILIIILFSIFIFPILQEIEFVGFLNHPIEKTDLDWQINSVNCIKSSLSEVNVVGLLASNNSGESILMTEYQLQNLFVPIVLDFYEPWNHEFTVIYYQDPEKIMAEDFSERKIIAKCDDHLILVREQEK
jgi:hypothetical protein